MKIACIKTTSFRGVSIGAIHYYGRLVEIDYQIRPIELEYQIEQKHIDLMKKSAIDEHDYWEIGLTTARFFSKQQIVEVAIDVFNRVYDAKNDILVHHNPIAIWDSRKDKIVCCPPNFQIFFNNLPSDKERSRFLIERYQWN